MVWSIIQGRCDVPLSVLYLYETYVRESRSASSSSTLFSSLILSLTTVWSVSLLNQVLLEIDFIVNINYKDINIYVALIAFQIILPPTVHQTDRRCVHPIIPPIVSVCVIYNT